MKIVMSVLSVLVVILNVNGSSIVVDGFNADTYSMGQIIGNNGWFNREQGQSFSIHSGVAYEGSSALVSGNSEPFGIITKKGSSFADGYQSFYFLPEQVSSWGSPRSFQFGIFQDSWDGPSRAVMSFRSDGHSYYIDRRTDSFIDMGTFIENTWNSAEIEWRSFDTSARYRVNAGEWTEWTPFIVTSSYSYFDTVGISIISLNGGTLYIDALGTPVPEPGAIWIGIVGLCLMHRKR